MDACLGDVLTEERTESARRDEQRLGDGDPRNALIHRQSAAVFACSSTSTRRKSPASTCAASTSPMENGAWLGTAGTHAATFPTPPSVPVTSAAASATPAGTVTPTTAATTGTTATNTTARTVLPVRPGPSRVSGTGAGRHAMPGSSTVPAASQIYRRFRHLLDDAGRDPVLGRKRRLPAMERQPPEPAEAAMARHRYAGGTHGVDPFMEDVPDACVPDSLHFSEFVSCISAERHRRDLGLVASATTLGRWRRQTVASEPDAAAPTGVLRRRSAGRQPQPAAAGGPQRARPQVHVPPWLPAGGGDTASARPPAMHFSRGLRLLDAAESRVESDGRERRRSCRDAVGHILVTEHPSIPEGLRMQAANLLAEMAYAALNSLPSHVRRSKSHNSSEMLRLLVQANRVFVLDLLSHGDEAQ